MTEPAKESPESPESPEDAERAPRDSWRALRKTVAQTVLVFTVPFVLAWARAVLGFGNAKVHRDAGAWTVWSAGVALMVAGSVFAVLLLRGGSRNRVRAWWCGGLWAAGLGLALSYSTMVDPPVR